jgi:hypothetical protein
MGSQSVLIDISLSAERSALELPERALQPRDPSS